MHRNRTWSFALPEERIRNRTLSIEGGDGSTLSLDFTTGVLDQRLTFTRSTNATFINSGGLVQYADANLVVDTEIVSAPSFPWNPFTATGGSNTLSNGVVVSASGSSGRAFYRQTLSNLAIGLQYSFAIEITAQSGGETYAQSVLPAAAGVTGAAQYYVNGSPRNSGDSVETGLVCVVWTAASTSIEMRIGVGANGTSANKSVTWTKPRAVPGNIRQPSYFANSSTTAAYQAPRFDYDPTSIGTPRGLLIEGSSNNLVFRSQSLNTSPWNRPAAVSVSETGSGSPANDNTSNVVTWTNSTGVGSAWLEQSITVSGSQPYTWSVWLKQRNNQRVSVFGLAKNSGGSIVGNIETTVNFSVSPPTVTNTVTSGYTSVTTPTLTEYPNGWYRMVATGTTPATAASTSFGISNKDAVPATGTNGCEVWGAQLEAGSGASSYIPSGASQGNRGQDLVSITTTNFSSWWTSNNPASFLVDISSTNRPLANHIFRIADSSGSAYGYQSYFFSTTMPMQVRAVMSSTAGSDVAIGSNLAANTRTKIGFTVETASLKRFRDGSLAHTLATPTLPPNTLTQMYIGGNSSFGNASADFHIKQFKYWPVTLSDAAMQGFTT